MDWKRISSALIGFPLVVLVLLLGNKIVISIVISLIAIMCMYEYFNAVSKKAKPIKWIGYLSCLVIAIVSFISIETLKNIILIGISVIFAIMFFNVVISDMKKDFQDATYTLFGIIYIVFFLIFFVLIRNLENGKILIWYPIFIAWGTDVFAYIFGKRIGKHKFSKISPKKTVEGCIAGTIGAIIVVFIYTFLVNKFTNLDYSYIYMIIITLVLSVLSQIGDFTASSIKRYVEIKDYSELIPGHGGMLDRIDSLLFIAPFAYILLSMII